MPTFRKYAFPDQATADEVLESLQPLDNAVPLGHLCAESDEEGNCIKYRTEFCYDILFNDTPPAAFTPYIVWPTPIGVHSFLGWDAQYAADYQEFATPSTL